MSEPLSHPDLRRRNLALLLSTVLRHEQMTRKQIEQQTGLSKATVSRLVDELLHAGALLASPTVPASPSLRGRPSETLRAPSALGAAVGVSLGIRTTSVFVTDLAGRELAWDQQPTPMWTSFDEAVAWVVGVTTAAVRGIDGPLQRVVVALPARAIDGAVITRAPLFMASIEGDDFARVLGERLACPVRIELDAAMVLVGLGTLGFVDRATSHVLLNFGSVLTMSLRRRDGSIAGGASAAFGDFDLIPTEVRLGTSRLGPLLGAHGLFEASQRLGSPLSTMEELWETERDDVRALRDVFASALAEAIRIVIVMADPGLIILTGRLSPLARLALPDLRRALERELAQPPELQVIHHGENDYPAAVGAASEANRAAAQALLDRVSHEGLDALRQRSGAS